MLEIEGLFMIKKEWLAATLLFGLSVLTDVNSDQLFIQSLFEKAQY